MSPAQRRRKFRERRVVKKSVKPRFIKLCIGFLILMGSLWFLYSSIWRGADAKISLVISSTESDVRVVTFDPSLNEVTNILIPGDTQVNVARGLGSWKIKSVWQLGVNEGLDGQLLKETIIKNFHFPITSWAGDSASGFIGGGTSGLVKALVLPYKTNLKLSERLKIAQIYLKAKNTRRVDIDLSQTQTLTKSRLTDGSVGFILTGQISEKLIVAFSDKNMSKEGANLIIRDLSGSSNSLNEISSTLEVLGAKVAASLSEESQDIDCIVFAHKKQYAVGLAKVLSCSVSEEPPTGSFDIELVLGSAFARRF